MTKEELLRHGYIISSRYKILVAVWNNSFFEPISLGLIRSMLVYLEYFDLEWNSYNLFESPTLTYRILMKRWKVNSRTYYLDM